MWTLCENCLKTALESLMEFQVLGVDLEGKKVDVEFNGGGCNTR